MPVKRCPDPRCQKLIPVAEYRRHVRTHRGPQLNGRNGSTRQWRKVRQAVMARDNFMCCRCGRTPFELEADEKMEVHHIDGNHRNSRLENLITVCSTHHDRSVHV